MQLENEVQHYRAKFDLYPFATQDPAFPVVASTILNWVKAKEERRHTKIARLLKRQEGERSFVDGGLSYPKDYHGGMSTEKYTKIVADSLATSDGKVLWALEYDEPDGKLWYRHWHTSIGSWFDPSDTQGPCRINVRISFYTLPSYIGEEPQVPPSNVPNFMRSIISLSDYQTCVGETEVLSEEKYLDGSNFKSEFADNLLSCERKLPLILMVTDSNGETPVWDATGIAQNVMGMANVYVADYRDAELRRQLFDLFKKGEPSIKYRCNPGMLRIYRPKIDLADLYGYGFHRYMSKNETERYYEQARALLGTRAADENAVKEKGNKLISDVLSKSFSRSIVKEKGDVLDISDVDAVRSRVSIESLRRRFDELNERTTKAIQEEQEKSASSRKLPESVTQELRDWQEMANQYLAEYENELEKNVALQQRNDNLESQQDSLQYHLDSLKERADTLAEEMKKLKIESDVIVSLNHIPTNLSDELRLAARLWPTRLTVLDDAHASAADFSGKDLDEQWKILSSMANELWDLYFEDDSDDIERDFKAKTSFDLALTEKRLTKRNNDVMRQRKRLYKGKAVDFTPHVKGKNKKPQFALRVHYYIDRESRLIVIGHCGSHLTTSGTQKVR